MKTKILSLSLTVCSITSSWAQTTFQKTFGGINPDWGSSVQQTADGGYIIAGTTGSFGVGSSDFYLLKADANGNSLWTKTFGGTNNDYSSSVQQTADGGYIIVGYTNSFGAGDYDVYLVKTFPNGDTLWTKTFGGISADLGYSVQQTSDGGYIIAGTTTSFGTGSYDVYLIKTDANGNSLWTRTFGGVNNDVGSSVQQTTDGGYVIAGNTSSFGAGFLDVYLVRTDANGNPIWTKTFGGTSIDDGFSVQQTTDGGYIITGRSESFGAGNWDVYLLKTDTNGNALWTKIFGGIIFDIGSSVQQTADGGYIIAGYTISFSLDISYDVYLIKTDTNGDTLWTKTFGGTNADYGSFVQQTADGGYVIAGWTNSFGVDSGDVYLIKTDSLGISNCNEANAGTIVTAPATVVSTPATQVGSGGIVGNPPTQTSSGGTVTTLCFFTGIDKNNTDDESISIYPNPCNGMFNVQWLMINGNTSTINHQPSTIEIYNVLGEKIYSSIINYQLSIINLNAPDGIYFIQLKTEQGITTKKLIIQ